MTTKWLVPYERNPRKNDGAVDRMVASIQEFGFKTGVGASDGQVVDGHLRLKAALKLGIREIPVILCDEWTPAQVKAFRLLVTRSVTWAEWDEDLLAVEFGELKGLDFNLALTGFAPGEVQTCIAQLEWKTAARTEEDAVPPVPPLPVTRPGDLWVLGRHRVSCADASDLEAVDRLMQGRKADLVFIDPPYNVNYDGRGSVGESWTRAPSQGRELRSNAHHAQ